MRYILIKNPGEKAKLTICDGAEPKFNEYEVLVKVRATALNRADILQRFGKYPPPDGESEIPGLELSGDVLAVGSQVTRFKTGDRVYGLVGSGAYAEQCVVNEELLQHIPPNLDYETAAGIPEALTTVYATLYDLGQLKAGQSLLIHGAGSGIASLGIQMAKLSHAEVITTVGTSDKLITSQKLGADLVINHTKQDFFAEIGINKIDLIVDFIGGDYFSKHLQLLKPNGKLIQIACMKGHKVECNLLLLMQKRLQINGFVLRSQSLREKARLWRLAHVNWYQHLESGVLKPHIDSIFSFNQIALAQQKMIAGQHFGKIIVRIP
ncbi:NAD(P)H-quinone oxidoreductase [Legionella waltersii]|uniref:Quinone oxidoreductase n=1 Tax=Legionella waltersii TaxID=66969 RepID=A0A0W1AAP9_9GAMM|nr:NAD(P)H-quinone oxidoreductase [Legionella waltersii]KTD78437.1 quinone oxidoreductase [Legionella waltersii]SNV06040.1 quinone oxidoreductase [Legionella waltersii]